MKIQELVNFEPTIGDIVEFETDPDTVVEGVIVAETEDGYIFEFSTTGLTELTETCTYGKYFCSTDKKWKCQQGPKQTRATEGLKDPEDNPCWDGYKPVGTKKKNGRTVPNCVPATESKNYWEKLKEERNSRLNTLVDELKTSIK